MVHVPLMFLSELREFPSAPCLVRKKNLMTARVSMMLKSRQSPDMLSFSLCNKKRLAVRHINRRNSTHEQTPLSNDTIHSVLRHREVGRAKDVSAPPRNFVLFYSRNVMWYHIFGCTVPVTDHLLYLVGFQLLGSSITIY